MATGRKVFTLLVEMRCNSYCVFCGQREVDEALIRARGRRGLSVPETRYGALRGRYTLATATEALARARADGFTELSLQGGEPTVFTELPALIGEARRLGFHFIGMVTNGRRLADAAFAEAVVGAGLDAITASLLGPDAATHDAVALAPGAFDELCAGLENVVAAARRIARPIKVNANVIVTAPVVERLADEVRLLARLGVQTATMHLVRFSGLASDETVRAALRFDARRLTPALAEAQAEGARLGVRLHATDVPACLHPRLAAEELELIERRAAVEEHRFEAAAFGYQATPRRIEAEACARCLLGGACGRVPPEYLPPEPIFSPITVEKLEAELAALLAAARPDAAAVARLVDFERVLAAVERMAGGAPLAPARARVDDALADLALEAFRRRDGEALAAAFFAALGLHPSHTLRVDARAWAALAAAPQQPDPSPSPAATLAFARDLAVAVDGEWAGDDLAVRALAAAHPPARGPRDRVLAACFRVFIAGALAPVRRLRVTDEGLDGDAGAGWVRVLSAARRGSIRALKSGG